MQPHDLVQKRGLLGRASPRQPWKDYECSPARRSGHRTAIATEWAAAVPTLIKAFVDAIEPYLREEVRIAALEMEVTLLEGRIAVLEEQAPVSVEVQSLAPGPYEIIKPFHVVVRVQDGEYIASFFDARISATGDTQEEAVYNLKDIIIGAFELLSERSQANLGAAMVHQKAVLQEFIRPKE